MIKVKHHNDGRVERYKRRLVAKGFTQLYGDDFDEHFHQWYDSALFVHCCPLLSLNNLHVHQMDVVTAFLNGHLEEEIYMEQPEGYMSGTPGVQSKKVNLWTETISSLLEQRFWWFVKESGFKLIHQTPVCS